MTDRAFLYSVVRFCPDTIKDEHVNVGLIVGRVDTGEWAVRRLEHSELLARAEVFAGAAPLWAAWEYLDRRDPATGGFTREWLEQEGRDKGNLIQLTAPRATLADTLDGAANRLFVLFLAPGYESSRPASREGGSDV